MAVHGEGSECEANSSIITEVSEEATTFDVEALQLLKTEKLHATEEALGTKGDEPEAV